MMSGGGPSSTPLLGVTPQLSSGISGATTPGRGPRMMASEFNFTSRYTVMKSSWRGKYSRIFSISSSGVATIDPKTMFRVTNAFDYGSQLLAVAAATNSPLGFTIEVDRGGGKLETMQFSCSTEKERAELLTDVEQHRERFSRFVPRYLTAGTGAAPNGNSAAAAPGRIFETRKCTFNDVQALELLRVTRTGVEHVAHTDRTAKKGEYLFHNIKGLSSIGDHPTTVIIAHGPVMKLHLYDFPSAEDAQAFVKLVQVNAQRFIGLPPYRPMRALTMEQFTSDRYGIRRETLETAVEFAVLKVSARHGNTPVRRLLGTTPTCLVERDPATYNTVGAYLLTTIFSLVRCTEDDQKFCIHFKDPAKVKVFTSPQRDALLAHLVDACREADNLNASVVAELVDRGQRSCPFRCHVTEDLESTLLNSLVEPEKKRQPSFAEIVSFFNANVEYGGLRWSENKEGLFAENREKLIYSAIHSLLFHAPVTEQTHNADLIQQFQALRRLTVSRTGFSSVAVVPSLAKAVGASSVFALRRNNMAVTHAVIDFLNTLMTPLHNNYELEHESINKNRIAGASSFLDSLLETLRANIRTESASLVVQELLKFFVYVLCPPYSETTDAAVFRRVMEELVKVVGKGLFPLLNHPCHAIRYAAGQLIRVTLEEGTEEQFRFMQRAALTEGGVLMEFNVGAFGRNRRLRDLARRLLAYWAFDNVAMQDLLRRMVPLTMLNFLQSTQEPPSDEQEPSPAKPVTQMTQQFRDARNGWFHKSFHPRSVVPQTERHTPQRPRREGNAGAAVSCASTPRATAGGPVSADEKGEASDRSPRAATAQPAEGEAPGAPGTAPIATALVPTHAAARGGGGEEGGEDPAREVPHTNGGITATEHAAANEPETENSPVPDLPQRQDTAAARLRMRHVNIHSTLNWPMFFHQLKRNHMQPDLIWTHTTRDELRRAIEAELDAFQMGSELRSGDKAVAWNYQEFEVVYHSLDEEVRVGQHYYPRLLFESSRPVVARPKEFFNELYHRFLLVDNAKQKLECLHGMSLLFKFYAEAIGEFSDLPFLVRMFQNTTDPAFRDRMLVFLSHALGARHNIKVFLDCNALAPLVELVTLAQLHIDRPQVHAVTNAIEYGGGSLKDLQGREKEWFYSKSGTKADPVSFTTLKELFAQGEIDGETKVWAQGMSGWKPMRDVAQLRWGVICAGKPSILSYTEVTCTILDIFQRICDHYPTRDEDGAVMQPLPRVKRYLSSPAVLPHLVQLLLTFDSTVCSRVHKLLFSLMQDNPLIGRFFLTGVFYFSLLYSGSDVLPMAKLLHLAHRQQSYQFAASNNSIVRSSILAPLLPPAMICFLTHHGPEKFADVFLGDYETPEIIWGKGMRRYLAGKVAAHIADFTPRLLGNNLVQFQYCPIVGVEYEQLQHELFCSEYYLRHLCDEARYPNWPIRDPIHFLRDVLTTWRGELEKEPSTLTKEGCLAELELAERAASGEQMTPAVIRKAYFTLAAKFHPDKNPNGRERFERIQDAYEFLAADKQYSAEPDPKNIRLLLRSQSILFRRYGGVLKAYKYAGYRLLLTLIKKEFADEKMLEKEVVLMEPATELCFATVKNVPMNTDELQEEGGMHLLAEVVRRCFDHVNLQTGEADPQATIAKNCMLTFAVSAQFKDCRTKLLAEPVVPYLASKGVAFHETIMPLARACIQCCETLCLDATMQARVTKAGAVWHLLRFLFCYDPTLDTAGVNLEERHHAQLFANRAAIFALKAIYALVGFHPNESYCQTARNDTLVRLLRRLLTPYITTKMERIPGFETEALTLLNGNWETPYFLWNNSTRAELEDLLVRNSEVCRDASIEATPAELPSSQLDGAPAGPGGLPKREPFVYSLHKGEVIVGGVFVRLYVAQPAFPIEDPSGLSHALLDYVAAKTGIASKVEQGKGSGRAGQEGQEEDVPPLALAGVVAMVVHCLTNLTLSYFGEASAVASQRMPVIVHVLSAYSRNKEVLLPTLSLLERLLPSEACLAALGADPLSITRLLFVLLHSNANKGDEEVQLSTLQVLRVMLAHRPLVQQALDRGLYMALLMLYATGREQNVKEAACLCLGKLFDDKLIGPKVYLRCTAYLPAVFLDSMKESTNAAQTCVMLDSWQENPELLWNKDRKERFIAAVSDTLASVKAFLEKQPDGVWTPQESQTPSAQMNAEQTMQSTQVGGVFLSLYLQQSGWQVRKPKEFLVALLDSYMELTEQVKRDTASRDCQAATRSQEPTPTVLRLNLITDCGVRLLSTSATIRDYAASLGYMHKLTDLVAFTDGTGSKLDVRKNALSCRQVPITALRWLHELWQSTACVEATAPKDVVQPLLAFLVDYEAGEAATSQGVSAISVVPASLPYVSLVMESLEELFSHSSPRVPIVAQAMRHNLVEILLHLLEAGISSPGTGSASPTAAQGTNLPTGLVPPAEVSPAATRALIIKVIKAIVSNAHDFGLSEKLNATLSQSAVWAKYKDQSHDLFLTSGNPAAFGGYLTAGSGSAGPGGATLSLTVAATNPYQDMSEPPPLQE